ncbi:MAG TPA: serine protein kinase [Planctomycetes bacterium]|nr:serine protein kinase [Planctomycetota bacterium]HIN80107.1 serine protein kinase [Planctomycetota bacterium]
MNQEQNLFSLISNNLDSGQYRELHWQGSFHDYLEMLYENSAIARTSFQRIYDMIVASGGSSPDDQTGGECRHWNFFDDPDNDGRDAVFGLDRPLTHLVNFLKAAAHGYGTERRVLLLHGPVGSAKSTIVRLIKKGLEKYSRSPEGALYTFQWQDENGDWVDSPMNEEPLYLVPEAARADLLEHINSSGKGAYPIRLNGSLCPFSRWYYKYYMEKYDGDWHKVINHVRVRRLTLSEEDRVGIGTFQPKDEKNQDSTELTGDINYRKIAEYGSESDPRAFNFDGEFNVANRGVIEFVEVLKLDVAFLYDLLGASQEQNIKPKRFAQTAIDEVIIGHTNEPEYRKLQSNELMEAFRDRTIKIDIPYNTTLSEEIRIYEKDYAGGKVKKHIAPHTLELCAMWALLTRLEEPKNAQLSLMQKLKLYDGKDLPGFTEENIKELRDQTTREGLEGISPRYIQDKISNALVSEYDYVNPFMILKELEEGLRHHSLISSEELRSRYRELLAVVREEYDDIVKNEVQRAISADEEAVAKLCANYIDNIKAYTQREKVRNPYTNQPEEPDERLMRSIEEKIEIPESRKDDFRREIMNYIGALAVDNKQFDFRTNSRLQKALELKLFEDKKDSIKLTTLVSDVIDKDSQEKIDVVKDRLIKKYGYNEDSATDVLNYVASIFARGDAKN